MTILSSKILNDTLNYYADQLLHYFVKHFGRLYGQENLSFNVHGLLHLANDCKNHGPVDLFSAFKFENQLQVIKKLVRSSNCPLQQVHRRLVERESQADKASCRALLPGLSSPFNFSSPLLPSNTQYFKQFNHTLFKVKVGQSDSVCELEDKSVVVVRAFFKQGTRELFLAQKFQNTCNAYKTPCLSAEVNIRRVSNLSAITLFDTTRILRKIFLLPIGTEFFAAPLNHL